MMPSERAWPEPDRCEYTYKNETIIAKKDKHTGEWSAFSLGTPTQAFTHEAYKSKGRARAQVVRMVMESIDSVEKERMARIAGETA